MVQNKETLNNFIKIHKIRTKIKTNSVHQTNKNFEEFRKVYGYDGNKKARSEYCMSKTSVANKHKTVRPLTEMKSILIEMPALGSEQAIVQPQYKKCGTLPIKKSKKVVTVEKDTITDTHGLVKKLAQMEQKAKKKSSTELSRIPSTFLEKTYKEIELAEQQLEQIKHVINNKQTEKPKTPKTPTYKAKKRNYRHNECTEKKYFTTLSTMQQKLKKLEEKYFRKPQIVYRNVNDTFTQFSNVEILYENNKYPEDMKIGETLKVIINELDDMANNDVDAKYKTHTPRNLSFKQPFILDEETRSLSKIIDSTENKVKKFNNVKRNIIDVEAFCDEICNITKDVDEEAENTYFRKETFGDNETVFDGSKLQNSVLDSCYLMKEFNIEPRVKVFSDTDKKVGSRNKLRDLTDKFCKTGSSSNANLLKNLSSALENSIYTAEEY